MNYEKIIVRNKITRRSEMGTQLCIMTSDVEFNNVSNFMSHYGLSNVMNNLLQEEYEGGLLEDSALYKEYINIKQRGKDNDYFSFMYRVKDDMAVKLSEHITIYHIVKDLVIETEPIVPWYYADSEHYIADTWWESDDDILNDLLTLPFVEFLFKYKGY